VKPPVEGGTWSRKSAAVLKWILVQAVVGALMNDLAGQSGPGVRAKNLLEARIYFFFNLTLRHETEE
jgi:hypothetical protein